MEHHDRLNLQTGRLSIKNRRPVDPLVIVALYIFISLICNLQVLSDTLTIQLLHELVVLGKIAVAQNELQRVLIRVVLQRRAQKRYSLAFFDRVRNWRLRLHDGFVSLMLFWNCRSSSLNMD